MVSYEPIDRRTLVIASPAPAFCSSTLHWTVASYPVGVAPPPRRDAGRSRHAGRSSSQDRCVADLQGPAAAVLVVLTRSREVRSRRTFALRSRRVRSEEPRPWVCDAPRKGYCHGPFRSAVRAYAGDRRHGRRHRIVHHHTSRQSTRVFRPMGRDAFPPTARRDRVLSGMSLEQCLRLDRATIRVSSDTFRWSVRRRQATAQAGGRQ
jgi:hypothetical protein